VLVVPDIANNYRANPQKYPDEAPVLAQYDAAAAQLKLVGELNSTFDDIAKEYNVV